MANFAALIDVLSIAGSRLSDGTANDSGKVYFFQPGGNTPVSVYSDAEASAIVTAPVTLTDGGLVSRSDYPDGIFATQPIRLYIEDSDGTVVSDTVYVPATAGNVGLSNDGFTSSTLDDGLTALFASTGGQDGKYKESAGATARPVQDKFREQGISVTDFGAVGDGVAIDTTAIQSAMNRAKALSTNVIFPAGTYKIDQALTLTSATGVSLRGQGQSASKIVTSHATANIFTLTTCVGFSVDGLGLSAAATNSGSAIALSGCTFVTLRNVVVSDFGGGSFLIPFDFSASSNNVRIDNCDLTPKQADATGRTIRFTNTSDILVVGGSLNGNAGAAIEYAGTTSRATVVGVLITAGVAGSPKGFLWTAAMTGQDFVVAGCTRLRPGVGLFSVPFDVSALTTDPRLYQYGNGVDGLELGVLSGATVTPLRAYGPNQRFTGTTTGSAYVVAAPIPTPVAGATSGQKDVILRIAFVNNAGGAVTGWTLHASYHTTAAISTVNLNITTVTFLWDATDSVWRELARAVTT